jgi:hypothetical protein
MHNHKKVKRISMNTGLEERINYCIQNRVSVDPITKCWNWTGAIVAGGYGSIRINNQLIGAHVFFFWHFKGDIPNDREIDHNCFNTGCVNPDHLEAVTHEENLRRRRSRWKQEKLPLSST